MTTIALIIAACLAIVLGSSLWATGPKLKDALVKATRALPASTTAVTSSAIDTGVSSAGEQRAAVEFELSAPLVTTAQLPDTKVFVYDVIHSDNADLSSPSTLIDNAITQTGASSSGAAADSKRFKLPSNAKRYIGFTVSPSASGTGDASGATATLEGVF